MEFFHNIRISLELKFSFNKIVKKTLVLFNFLTPKMSLDPRRHSIRDARKTAFKTRKSNVNSLAQFGITGLSSIRTVLIY